MSSSQQAKYRKSAAAWSDKERKDLGECAEAWEWTGGSPDYSIVSYSPSKSPELDDPETMRTLFLSFAHHVEIQEFRLQFSRLQSEMARLVESIAGICASELSFIVPVETLHPEPYRLTRPFSVVVQRCDDQYTACFYDANINASGDTPEEAVANLKDVLVSVFEELKDRDALGPALLKQKAVLKDLLQSI